MDTQNLIAQVQSRGDIRAFVDPNELNFKKECVSKFHSWKFISGRKEVKSESSTAFYPIEKMYSPTHQFIIGYFPAGQWDTKINKIQ